MTEEKPRVAPGTWREVGPDIAVLSRVFSRVSGTEPPAVFLTLGNRGLFWGWLHFAGRLMPGGRLPRRQSEMVILRVEAGGLDGWEGSDRTLLSATDELLATEDLTDAAWAALRAEYDERRAIEIVMLVGHYRMLPTALRTLRVQPDLPRRWLTDVAVGAPPYARSHASDHRPRAPGRPLQGGVRLPALGRPARRDR